MIKKGVDTRFKIVEVANVLETISAEDDYDFKSYDLNTARTSPGSTLGIAGDSLTVFALSGSCHIRFDGTAKPAISLEVLTWPSMVVFERAYTNVYLQNSSQAGSFLKLYAGKRT